MTGKQSLRANAHHQGYHHLRLQYPLFTFALKKVVPVRLPAGAMWVNYHDSDDILDYPPKPIRPAYLRVVRSDTAINVGGLFSSWNPLPHKGYWTDNDFTKPVGHFISRLL